MTIRRVTHRPISMDRQTLPNIRILLICKGSYVLSLVHLYLTMPRVMTGLILALLLSEAYEGSYFL